MCLDCLREFHTNITRNTSGLHNGDGARFMLFSSPADTSCLLKVMHSEAMRPYLVIFKATDVQCQTAFVDVFLEEGCLHTYFVECSLEYTTITDPPHQCAYKCTPATSQVTYIRFTKAMHRISDYNEWTLHEIVVIFI